MQTITLKIATQADADSPVRFSDLPGEWKIADVGKAMAVAKKAAGKGARYCGDGLSIRYAGEAGTVYLRGVSPR